MNSRNSPDREIKIVFICGAPRSGTTLLANLLDGHPDILMCPGETHILQYWNFHKSNNSLERFFSRDYLKTNDVLLLIDKVAQEQQQKYKQRTYDVDHYLPITLDRRSFVREYRRVLDDGVSLKNVYTALYRALIASKSCTKKVFVEKRPFDNELAAMSLYRIFPGVKFVHIIRDPRTRYISAKMRRVRRKGGILPPRYAPNLNGKDFATAHSEITMTSMELARLNKEVIGDQYHIVLFEQLLKNPESEMRKIASHLDVAFGATLLRQTSNGREHHAVSSIDKGMSSGIKDTTDSRLKTFMENTSELERRILYLFTCEIGQYFKYDIPVIEDIKMSQVIWPLKYEHPKDYLGNRIYMAAKLRGQSSAIRIAYFHDILNKFDKGIPTQD